MARLPKIIKTLTEEQIKELLDEADFSRERLNEIEEKLGY